MGLEKLKAVALAATPGPWHWVNPENDKPRRPGEWRASLRTIEEFPTRSVGPLPHFILAAEEISSSDDKMEENAAFIAAANPAAVLELIAEVERLSAIVEEFIDPKQVMLTGLNVHNGSFSMGLEGGPVRLFSAAFADYFKESAASNYIEMSLASTDPEIGELICTLQRKQGRTPHALRREAEVERDQALENAARACEAQYGSEYSPEYNSAAEDCARAIRALKGT